ncbi:MAG: aspartate--tRNA(Asn) ligase [Patescibacteria group bacterium]
MNRTLISETVSKVGETVLLQGWVDTRRDHGKIVFIDLRDRTGKVQMVLMPGLAGDLKSEDVISLTGLVKARPEKLINPRLATGTVEIEAQKIEVLSRSEVLPFDMSGETLDVQLPTLLDHRSLTLRHPKVQAIFKVQAVIIDSFRRALQAKDFLEFQSPSIISSIPEGGSEVFEVKYFENKAYLSQSPQLYKSLLVGDFERVFSVNKVFRAEPSVTTRHLTEVVSLDAEFGFIESWLDVLAMEEYVVRFIFSEVEKKCSSELAMFGATLPKLSGKIPLIKLREAQEIILKRTGRDVRHEKDLAPEDEREICKWSLEEHGSDLVFVSHFLTKKKPFYVMPDPEDPEFALSVDLLGRGVEWSSGGQRLNDYEQIKKNVQEWGLKEEDVALFLQSFKYGVPPLGGFALGAERMTMHILGLQNIREASMFPRDMERVDFRLGGQQTESKGEKVYKQILEKLAGVEIKTLEHKETKTSADSAHVRGTTVEQGAKALVAISDETPVLLVLSAAKKADLDKAKIALRSENLHLASETEMKKITGLEIGAVPPFGSVLGLKTYVDNSLSENEEIAFNAGLRTKSIIMKFSDYRNIESPQVCDIS